MVDSTPTPDPTQATSPPAPEDPTRRLPASDVPRVLSLALLLVLLACVSGAVGALLTLHFHPAPPPLRVAVIDTTKLAEAVAQAAARDPGIAASFPHRFDQAVHQLQEADPHRLLLVREAVLGPQMDDLTPEFLQLLPSEPAVSSPPPRSAHAPR